MRNRTKRRRRASIGQMLREAGPNARTAFRHARVWLWRFKRSPERQDRATMLATFACIGVFAMASVDAVITGGADFGPSAAYAGEYQEPTRAPAALPAPVAPVETPAALKAAAPAEELVDYSFTTEELLGGPVDVIVIGAEPLAMDAIETVKTAL